MTEHYKLVPGFLGIDIGTQGLSAIFCDQDLRVLATGEGSYGFATTEDEQKRGFYEQLSSDWLAAVKGAMQEIHQQFAKQQKRIQVLACGISGQMHGEVLIDESGRTLEPVRIWCDARNAVEADELTNTFQFKVPKRSTCARFLWTARNRPHLAKRTAHITTPAGWLAHVLTGDYCLGSGDAAGIFPVNSQTQNYDKTFLQKFDEIISKTECGKDIPSIEELLPNLARAGEYAGFINTYGADILGIPFDEDTTKIPMAAAEGDQVASLAGSLIGKSGVVACSFGTSVCANVVADASGPQFQGVSLAVDHFTSADGKPIHMIWIRNGTNFLNAIVESYGSMLPKDTNPFTEILPDLINAPPDCGGLLALPFMDDEPGLGVSSGGSALVVGWNAQNRKPGNVAKAALLSTIFNLKNGVQVLERQNVETRSIVLSGGLVKTPQTGQIVADVFNLPVTLLQAADEGCSWGASVLAKYRHRCFINNSQEPGWVEFLEGVEATKIGNSSGKVSFVPNGDSVRVYEDMYHKHKMLLSIEPQLRHIINTDL